MLNYIFLFLFWVIGDEKKSSMSKMKIFLGIINWGLYSYNDMFCLKWGYSFIYGCLFFNLDFYECVDI